MSLKRPSLIMLAKIINEVAYERQSVDWNAACARVALRMSEYFETQNKELNAADFLAACAVQGAGDATQIRSDQGFVEGSRQISEGGENVSGENLQLAASTGTSPSDG